MNAATSTRLLSRATLRAPWPVHGIVDRVTGILVESRGPAGSLGDSCRIECSRAGRQDMQAEIVGFRGATTLLMPLGELTGITPGDRVRLSPQSPTVPCGDGLRGRVIDELGRPIDGLGPLLVNGQAPLHREPPSPLARPRIRERLTTGVRAIDGNSSVLVVAGKMTNVDGQHIGSFAIFPDSTRPESSSSVSIPVCCMRSPCISFILPIERLLEGSPGAVNLMNIGQPVQILTNTPLKRLDQLFDSQRIEVYASLVFRRSEM